MSKKENEAYLLIRLPIEVKKKLKVECAASLRSLQSVIEELILNFLKE